MGLLDSIVDSNLQFGEALASADLEFEARSGITSAAHRATFRPRNGHRAIRDSCSSCGKIHTRSEHKSHGIGSFCRTHRGHPTCR